MKGRFIMKKKVLVLLLAVAMLAALAACGDTGSNNSESPSESVKQSESLSPSENESPSESETPTEPEKEETAYEITYNNARIYTDSIGTPWVQVIVEIENTGSADLYLSSGKCDLEDKDGNLVKSLSMVSIFPSVIATGEKAYLYEETTLDEAVEGEITALPRFSADKATVDNVRFNVTDAEITGDQFGFMKGKGRVENTTSEAEDGMTYIVFVLKDAESTPIGVMFTIMTDTLNPGDKFGFEVSGMSLPDDVTPDTVASFDTYAYPYQLQF